MSRWGIHDWKRFQHYKHRRPPWIRLYRELLENEAWMNQTDRAKAMLCELWMVASDNENGDLPAINVLAWRLRRASIDIRSAISEINPLFLDGASEMLALCEQDATPEKSRAEESRVQSTRSPAFAGGNGSVSPSNDLGSVASKPQAPARSLAEVESDVPPGGASVAWAELCGSIWFERRGGENRYIFDLAPAFRQFGLERLVKGWTAYLDSFPAAAKFVGSPQDFASKAGVWCGERPTALSPAQEAMKILERDGIVLGRGKGAER